MRPFKIAVITDLHFGPDQGQKKGSQAARILTEFSRWCAEMAPDVIVNLGDLIANTDREEDLQRIKECSRAFADFGQKVEHIMGNHDEKHEIAVEDWEIEFGSPFRSRFRDDIHPNYRIIFFSPTFHGGKVRIAGTPLQLFDRELEFLESSLATNRDCVICTHAPLHRSIWDGSPYWSKVYDTDPKNVSDWKPAKRVRELLRESRTCTVLSGHHHWDALHVYDDIAFIQINSATDASITWPEPSGRMGMLTISDCNIQWDGRGKSAHHYVLPRRQENRKWIMNWPED